MEVSRWFLLLVRRFESGSEAAVGGGPLCNCFALFGYGRKDEFAIECIFQGHGRSDPCRLLALLDP
jgi:hypothetical protein